MVESNKFMTILLLILTVLISNRSLVLADDPDCFNRETYPNGPDKTALPSNYLMLESYSKKYLTYDHQVWELRLCKTSTPASPTLISGVQLFLAAAYDGQWHDFYMLKPIGKMLLADDDKCNSFQLSPGSQIRELDFEMNHEGLNFLQVISDNGTTLQVGTKSGTSPDKYHSFVFDKNHELSGLFGTVWGGDYVHKLGVIKRTFNCPELQRFNAHKDDPDYRPPDDRSWSYRFKYPGDLNTNKITILVICIAVLILFGCIFLAVWLMKSRKKQSVKTVNVLIEPDKDEEQIAIKISPSNKGRGMRLANAMCEDDMEMQNSLRDVDASNQLLEPSRPLSLNSSDTENLQVKPNFETVSEISEVAEQSPIDTGRKEKDKSAEAVVDEEADVEVASESQHDVLSEHNVMPEPIGEDENTQRNLLEDEDPERIKSPDQQDIDSDRPKFESEQSQRDTGMNAQQCLSGTDLHNIEELKEEVNVDNLNEQSQNIAVREVNSVLERQEEDLDLAGACVSDDQNNFDEDDEVIVEMPELNAQGSILVLEKSMTEQEQPTLEAYQSQPVLEASMEEQQKPALEPHASRNVLSKSMQEQGKPNLDAYSSRKVLEKAIQIQENPALEAKQSKLVLEQQLVDEKSYKLLAKTPSPIDFLPTDPNESINEEQAKATQDDDKSRSRNLDVSVNDAETMNEEFKQTLEEPEIRSPTQIQALKRRKNWYLGESQNPNKIQFQGRTIFRSGYHNGEPYYTAIHKPFGFKKNKKSDRYRSENQRHSVVIKPNNLDDFKHLQDDDPNRKHSNCEPTQKLKLLNAMTKSAEKNPMSNRYSSEEPTQRGEPQHQQPFDRPIMTTAQVQNRAKKQSKQDREVEEMRQVLINIDGRMKKGQLTALDKKLLDKISQTCSENAKGYGGLQAYLKIIYGNAKK